MCIDSICGKSSLENVRILRLIVDGKQMQFNLPTEGYYRIGLFDQCGDTVPTSCTCIPDRFQGGDARETLSTPVKEQ